MKSPCEFVSAREGISNLTWPSHFRRESRSCLVRQGQGRLRLLDCIAGLVQPDEGRIATREQILFDSALGINLPPQLRRVGYVFQDLALFPHLTVQGNVEYGLSRLP